MPESDLKQREQEAGTSSKDFGGRSSDDEKSKLEGLNDQLDGNDPDEPSFYDPSNKDNKTNGKAGLFSRAKKVRKAYKAYLAIGIAGSLVAGIFGFITFMTTFKGTAVINMIEQRVGNVPQNAVDNRMEYYMSRFLIIEAARRAGTNVSDGPGYTYIGKGVFSTLHTNWKGANLAATLEKDYKIQVVAKPGVGNLTGRDLMRPTGYKLVFLDQKDRLTGKPREVDVSSPEGRQAMRDFAATETKSHQVFKRYNMRKVLKRYYGIGNWKPFEKTRDETADKYREKKRQFKVFMVTQTIGRVVPRQAIYLECLLGGGGKTTCRDKLNTPSDTVPILDAETADAAEADNPEADKNAVLKKLQEFGIKKALGSVIAGIGIIDLLSGMEQAIDDGTLSMITYDNITQQNAGFYTGVNSAADMVASGDAEIEDARVLAEMFDGFEASPVYTATIAGSSSHLVSAAGEQIQRECDEEKPGLETLPPGELVCPQKKAMQDKEDIKNVPGYSVFSSVMAGYRATGIGTVLQLAAQGIGKVLDATGISGAMSKLLEVTGVSKGLATLLGKFMNYVIGFTLTGDEKGIDAYEATHAGLLVRNSAVGGAPGGAREDTTGGKYLSTPEANEVRVQIYGDRQYALSRQNIFDRYLSPENSYSLTSYALVHTPTSFSSFSTKFINVFKPSNFFRNFSNIFTNRAGALPPPSATNPFGIMEFGYNPNDTVFQMEEDELRARYQCDLPAKDRPQNKEFGRPDGIPFDIAITTDPCQLEKSVEDAGSRFFTGNLDEGIDTISTTSGSSGNIGSLECPSTLRETLSIGSTTYYKLPDAPNSEYTIYSIPTRRYGQKELVCVLYTAAKAYKQKYGSESTMSIGDLNAAGHLSHRWGVGVDLDAVGNILAADHTKGPTYSPEATIDLGKALIDTGLIKNIWYCERGAVPKRPGVPPRPENLSGGEGTMNAIREYSRSVGNPIAIYCLEGHANHFHVDINIPRGEEYTP